MNKSQYWMAWTNPDVASGLNMEAANKTWFASDKFRRYPTKTHIRAAVAEVLDGWTPAAPIIHPETRVLAMGSCFAANFVEWLIAHGYNLPLLSNPHAGILRNAFENVSVVAQQFRWAFGEFDPNHAMWVDKTKSLVEPTEERRQVLKGLLEQAEVMVITLGLSEVWYDKQTNEPLWRVLPVAYHDPERHAFKVESVADTVKSFEAIESIRSRYLPNLKILYTVSPLRMRATFRPVSAVTANSVSKAIIRSALDEFLRSRADLNVNYFYFPSYDIVTDVMLDPFTDDQHHLHEHVLSFVLNTFAQNYTSLPASVQNHDVVGPELEKRLLLVEKSYDERIIELSKQTHHCAQLEREAIVLRQACEERLTVINQLSEEVQRLQKVVEQQTVDTAATGKKKGWTRFLRRSA